VPATVIAIQAAFEDLPLNPIYDLTLAAASMHWTTPDQRWPRVSAMLTQHGVFASFGGPMHLADPDVENAVRAARSEFLANDDIASPDGTPADSPMQWPGTELINSGLFVDVRQSEFERRVAMSAHHYVGHLSTVSAYLALPDAVRAVVLDRILRVLPKRVTLIADLTLHLARKP
jgi:hypothetical protein